MPQPNDLSRSLVALDQDSTIIAVVEMSQSSWLVAGMLPGIERQPRKKLDPSPERLLALLHRWRDEAVGAGRTITRIALAFEAGRDGFWLARWLAARGIEAHVIHPSSVAVSREHRRAAMSDGTCECLKPMLFDDDDPTAAARERASIVAPAQSSPAALRKRASKLTANGGPVHSFHSLLRDLATCTLNEMTTTLNHAYSFTLVATPTPIQAQAFTLLDVDPTKL